ncbi:methionine ABC transporter permease [Clostridium formicaceticum]|uniref:Methionine ABC transporter permease n=1 Tax=Clostridium formicaceticum TaxID=1497 RepID=A0AAC9WF33_9CLOT|nr:methionine ABC transporter permease [Clostridium formicaceticum]AOY75920.1 methionine ABC transporter permease [Clostridium formicaceticum]ARE86264.1 Methionine import system permease protein MetP [Clostridium formicaceticum]
MQASIVTELVSNLTKAMGETFEMVGISLFAAIILGVPLGLFIYITSQGLFFESKTLNFVGGILVNVIRSVPFVILLVLLLPLTKLITGTTIGAKAASVPLSVAAVAFYARLVEASFREVDRGVIEAAIAIGAKPFMIIRHVLLTEALPSLINGVTVTAISLIGYSAMAGIVGGGGIGDLAIRFGYYRYETDVMLVTVVVLVVLVQVLQFLGDHFSKIVDKR